MAETTPDLTDVEDFVYDPLPTTKWIRLLRRDGETESGMLKFTMAMFGPLELNAEEGNVPPYHCLSYTWGNPHADCHGFRGHFDHVAPQYGQDQQIQVLCNGKRLNIGRSLHEAMTQLPKDCWKRRVRHAYDHINGKTALHTAATLGHVPHVQEYLEHGADVAAQDRSGKTALHWAAQVRWTKVAEILLEAGADPTTKDKKDKMPIAYSWENSDYETTETLMNYMMNPVRATNVTARSSDDWIWIDAMCINQKDISERNTVVMNMDSIYASANYVLAWLGPEDTSTELGIDAMNKILSVGDKFAKTPIFPYSHLESHWYDDYGLPHVSSEEWHALAALFSRQWFRRMWIIQEVAFARDIVLYCGKWTIHYANIATTCDYISRWYERFGFISSKKYLPENSPVPYVEYYMQVFHKLRQYRQDRLLQDQGFKLSKNPSSDPGDSPFDLSNLIRSTVPFMSTDPRDKLFALMSLWKLDAYQTSLPEPNYSINVKECYVSFTHALIRGTQTLDFLSWIQDKSAKRMTELPSWVPDFSLQSTNNAVPSHFNALPKEMQKIGPYRVLTSKEFQRFGLTGFDWDTVDYIAGPPEFQTTNILKLNQYWFELCFYLDVKYHTGESRTEALWRTLCRDENAQHKHPAPPEFEISFKKLVCAMVSERAEKSVEHSCQFFQSISEAADILQDRRDSTSDNTGTPTRVMQYRMEALENKNLSDGDFAHVRTLLWVLELLACTELDPNDPSISRSHTPSPTEIERYLHDPEWHTEYRNPHPVRVEANTIRITAPPVGPLDEKILSPSLLNCSALPFGQAFRQAYDETKRLFVTRNKYIGVGPASVQKGDAVFLLPGARAPFVLRQCRERYLDDKSASVRDFNVVGEAYVHGIMHGEAMAKDDKLKDKREFIYLV